MNKKILVSVLLVMAICISGCGVNSNKSNKPKPVTKVTKNKNEVPQTYEEWVARNGAPQKSTAGTSKTTKQVANTTATPSAPSSAKSNAAANNNKKGDPIPSWVYDNTSPYDQYYNVISSYSNIVFFSYADCPIGRGRRDMVSRAISRAGASAKFTMNADLHQQGVGFSVDCKKLREKLSDAELDAVVKKRQGDGPNHAIGKYDDGTYCVPTLVNNDLPEGACRCAGNYLIEECSDEICILNPRARRIVKVAPNEDQLVAKLNELKNNW